MSLNENPSTWRLETPGGIKYKLINPSPTGTADQESETAHEELIIQASDLAAFITESYSLMELSGETWVQTIGRSFPGNSVLKTSNISWGGYDTGRPSDPFGSDPDHPLPDTDHTYCDFIKLSIDYGGDGTGNDTLMEVASNASGEFLTLPVHNEDAAIESPGSGEDDPVEDVDMPVSKLMPTTEWTVRYPRLAHAALAPLIASCRWSMGTVNNAAMPIFFGADPETVLFLGYSHNEKFSLDNDPVTFELKFLEKNVGTDDGGNAIGHNHHFVPEAGEFRVVQIAADTWTYQTTDLNTLILL